MYYALLKTKQRDCGESLQQFKASIERLIRSVYSEAPDDFRMRFAMHTFIDGIRDCELQQELRVARH